MPIWTATLGGGVKPDATSMLTMYYISHLWRPATDDRVRLRRNKCKVYSIHTTSEAQASFFQRRTATDFGHVEVFQGRQRSGGSFTTAAAAAACYCCYCCCCCCFMPLRRPLRLLLRTDPPTTAGSSRTRSRGMQHAQSKSKRY